MVVAELVYGNWRIRERCWVDLDVYYWRVFVCSGLLVFVEFFGCWVDD